MGKLLKGGFYMPYGFIREPKSIGAAAALINIAMQSVQNNQFGGVATSDIDTVLKDYVFEDTTDREIEQAMEAMIYNFNSMHSRMGNQTVFASVPMGVDTDPRARRIAKAFLKEYKAGLGHHEQCLN